MKKSKKPADPLFGIWLDGRRIGGAFRIDDALSLLGACTRRWHRENASAETPLGAVQSADGALYLCAPLLLRRDDERALTEADWETVRATALESARRPWNVKIPPRTADKIVAGWSWGVEWKAAPKPARARPMEPDEDAPPVAREMFG